MQPHLTNTESLQRGARHFVNYCMGCHEAKFSRYERVATDLGIPEEIMMEQLVFSDQAIGDLMEIALRPGDAQQFFGRSEEHTSELQSRGHLVCRLLLEKQ